MSLLSPISASIPTLGAHTASAGFPSRILILLSLLSGMDVVKVGGPVYRIGVGGGAASSVQVKQLRCCLSDTVGPYAWVVYELPAPLS